MKKQKINKFDFSSTIDKIKASMKKEKDEKRASQFGLGNTLAPTSKDPADYVVMPDWWKEHYGVLGLEIGKIVQIAGDADTGKTSLALEAMLRAQQQGFGVIYVETERKTGEKDLIAKGIDPEGVMSVSSGVTEEAFDDAFKCWDGFLKDYPNEKFLLVYDSYGNTVSMRDTAIDMTKDSQKPGGTAKTNRMGINRMVARMQRGDPVAILVVNYTYANIGSKGQTNAGGKALNFFSTIILQSRRTGWLDVTRNKVKVRAGAKVRWHTYKNHYAKTLFDEEGKQILLPTVLDLSITTEGFRVLEPGDKTLVCEEGEEEVLECEEK
jgi:RecA/RadA recombinase